MDEEPQLVEMEMCSSEDEDDEVREMVKLFYRSLFN